MRLDRFLWFVRIVKTRSLAQDLVSSGRFRIDGRPVDRVAAPVRVGSVIAFAAPAGAVRAIRVETLPHRRGPANEARACYADLIENDSHQARSD